MTPEETPETLDEDASAIEIADACRGVLKAGVCDEIAEQENPIDALELAYTELLEAGEDPDEFLKQRNILEDD